MEFEEQPPSYVSGLSKSKASYPEPLRGDASNGTQYGPSRLRGNHILLLGEEEQRNCATI